MPRRTGDDPNIGERIRTRRRLRGWSIRFAADRAGLSHTTWSRIERGIVTADNRFTLADIARALDCSVTDLTGCPTGPDTRGEALLALSIEALHTALVDADPGEEPLCMPRPWPQLVAEADLVHHLRMRCNFLGAAQRLPALIREVHAATHGSNRREALPLLVSTTFDAAALVQTTGYRRDGWLAAQRCRQAAEATGDPVLLAFAGFAVGNAAGSAGAYARSMALVERAAEDLSSHLGTEGALAMLGMLHLTCAMAARGLRRPADSADRVAEAADLAARTGETMVHDLGFGPTNVGIWRVSMETDGGEPGRAAEIGAQLRPDLLPMPSRRATFHTDTARALTLLGRDRDALRHLLAAERISPVQVRSNVLVRETVRGMLDRAGSSQLRGLCERINLAR
ncbi:MAG TPA: helix-turn-helix transcriptional regulator [Mycobacteriales bacterium]|jgi:Predicted transcriptional regulators